MKVVQISQPEQRDACLAALCADVYGQRAGLTPLVVFTGTQNVLLAQEAARLLASVDEAGKPQALALLVLDEAGEGMLVSHACEFAQDAKAALISELAVKAPLRIETDSPQDEAFYQQCGIKRWWDSDGGRRIGLGDRHPAGSPSELSPTLGFDEALILRRFKHDPKTFNQAKEAFVAGLEHFPNAF